jgi:16S rRNA (guanine527-N7)-methyltransferase
MTEPDAPPADHVLRQVLHDSRELGFLGPGPIAPQLAHARAFLPLLSDARRVLDLGSGGGLPGLVLATSLVDAHLVLLDGNQRRCAFLSNAVERLGFTDRVEVELGRAEELARRPDLEGTFDVVVSRSFGAPAVTAECAVRFLGFEDPHTTGGSTSGIEGRVSAASPPRLLVSEPPSGSEDRWPAAGVAVLGLGLGTRHVLADATIQELDLVERWDDRFPRRVGIPTKRPLFGPTA